MVPAFWPTSADIELFKDFFLGPRDLAIASIGVGNSLQLLEHQPLVFNHFLAQMDHLQMGGAKLAFELGLHFGSGQIFLPELGNHGVAEQLRDGSIVRTGLQHLRDLVVARLGSRGVAMREHHLRVELGHLLVRDQLAVGGDQTFVSLELLNSRVGGQRIRFELGDARLHPAASASRRLIFGIELVGEVGLGKGVGDRGGLGSVGRRVVDGQDIGARDAANLQIILELCNRGAPQFRLFLRVRFLERHEPVV